MEEFRRECRNWYRGGDSKCLGGGGEGVSGEGEEEGKRKED